MSSLCWHPTCHALAIKSPRKIHLPGQTCTCHACRISAWTTGTLHQRNDGNPELINIWLPWWLFELWGMPHRTTDPHEVGEVPISTAKSHQNLSPYLWYYPHIFILHQTFIPKRYLSWWFQPNWKICSWKWESSPGRSWKINNILKPPPQLPSYKAIYRGYNPIYN